MFPARGWWAWLGSSVEYHQCISYLSLFLSVVWISYSVHMLERLLLVPSADPSLCAVVPGTSSAESGEKTKLCLHYYQNKSDYSKQEYGYVSSLGSLRLAWFEIVLSLTYETVSRSTVGSFALSKMNKLQVLCLVQLEKSEAVTERQGLLVM